MGSTAMQRTQLSARTIVYAGLIGAAYFVITVALAPISFGPLQLRVAGLLMPLALLSPIYGLGLAVGVLLANLLSPFGAWDFAIMPLVSYAAALVAWHMRSLPIMALTVQAILIALGVAIFPLYLGGGIPIVPTVLWVLVSLLVLFLVGWFCIWRNVREWV